MMNSEVRIAPVAAVCDRRRTDPKNPTGCWSVAAFVRKPQTEPATPTLHSPRQSSLIKPNQAIFHDSTLQDPPSASICVNLRADAFSYFSFLLSQFLISHDMPNQAHSSLIKPNQPISCLDAIQSQPPPCSKIATSPILLRQTSSKPVKASQSVSQSLPSSHGSSRHHNILSSHFKNAQPIVLFRGSMGQDSRAIRNVRQTQLAAPKRSEGVSKPANPLLAFCLPPLAFPLSSTWFHLIPVAGSTGVAPTALGSCSSGVVLFVADVFQPVHDFAVEGLGDGDVGHRGGWRRAMPVFFAGRKPDDVTGPDFLDGAAPSLRPAAAGCNDDGLTQRVRVPGGAGTRLEGDNRAADMGGSGPLER